MSLVASLVRYMSYMSGIGLVICEIGDEFVKKLTQENNILATC